MNKADPSPRPKTRGDCLRGGPNGQRPCPWDGCRYHLEHPDASCALDVANMGGLTLEEVGDYIGLSKERTRQIEEVALRRIRYRFPDFWKLAKDAVDE